MELASSLIICESQPKLHTIHISQICKAGLTQTRKIWLTRHGESEFNRLRLLGGDSCLSPKGEQYARGLPDVLFDRLPLVRSIFLHKQCYVIYLCVNSHASLLVSTVELVLRRQSSLIFNKFSNFLKVKSS